MTTSPNKRSPSPPSRERPASPPIHPSRRPHNEDRSRSPPPHTRDERASRTDSHRSGRDGDDRRRDFRDDKDRDDRRGRPKRDGGGFKFKQKRRDDEESFDDRERRAGGLERGYRNRSPRRDRDRDRDRDRERDERASGSTSKSTSTGGKKDANKMAPPRPAAGGGEEMIVVYVNDRMGTKSAIPCFGSDNVGQFRMLVAARIGRRPNEIMLKRQGERPFKDQLTLEDYGVSNGVQIDLEVDTGD